MSNEELKKMYKEAKEGIARPLSNFDMERWLKNNGSWSNITTYERLGSYDIGDLFENDCLILLYKVGTGSIGHWTTIIRRGKDCVEFMDPYGSALDFNLKFSNNKFPALSKILKEGGIKKIIFNNMRLQRMDNAISTCGRHCMLRVLFKNLTIEQYQRAFLKSGFKPALYDYYVYLLTADC